MISLLTIIRIVVGALFIFSGLIKANDPLGLSYKMQEFFELWGYSHLNHHTLWLSITLNTIEIILGIALIIGWRMRIISWLLLLMILFFTFLTGYAHLSGKFKNCGCFGDCIPISPLMSFIKDLVLLALIGFLTWHRKRIAPLVPEMISLMILLLTAIIAVWIQYYVLKHLPFIDCLPYKEDKNISRQMQIPPGAIPDSFAMRFIYEKEGKTYEFDMDELPADLETYTYKDRKDKLIRKGNAEPPIKGFSLTGISGTDSTDEVLALPACVILIAEHFRVDKESWIEEFARVYESCIANGIPAFLVTTSIPMAKNAVSNTRFENIPVFTCDFTAIRTAARTNPALYYLENGNIAGKWGYADFDEAYESISADRIK